jgi:hypothetical protein
MPSQSCTVPENHAKTNMTMFAMIRALTAGEIPPGPNEYDNPDGAG